jgi:hypothetical protein
LIGLEGFFSMYNTFSIQSGGRFPNLLKIRKPGSQGGARKKISDTASPGKASARALFRNFYWKLVFVVSSVDSLPNTPPEKILHSGSK